MKEKILLSWSGGKDGCMALDMLVKKGYEIASLVTTVPEEIGRTFGHGEKTELIKLQGEALNIPVHFIECTFQSYTDRFVETLIELKDELQVSGIAFGDLYLDEHREWGEKVCEKAGIQAIYPLWMKKEESFKALERFVDSGYKATVIRVREDVLDTSWLGKELDDSFLKDVASTNICPMGEAGEYHTYVYDGPLFTKKVQLSEPRLIKLETSHRLEFENYTVINK